MTKQYYKFAIDTHGMDIENLDLLMDEGESILQSAVEFDVKDLDPYDFLEHIAKFIQLRYHDIGELAESGETEKANQLMLETYRVFSIAGLRIGAWIK